jgi:hypothetical protein
MDFSGCTAAVNARGYRSGGRFFCRNFKLFRERWLARDNRAQLLADLDRLANLRFPFSHHSGER